jgi:hypothetical protein
LLHRVALRICCTASWRQHLWCGANGVNCVAQMKSDVRHRISDAKRFPLNHHRQISNLRALQCLHR